MTPTNKTREPLPTVEQCIAYIESTDYKLMHRSRGWGYWFKSPTRALHCQELKFSLGELRHAFKYGF